MPKSDTLTSAKQALPFRSKKTQKEPQITEEQIRFTAYLRWEEAGCPIGEDERFWLEAEQQLQDR